MAAPEALELPRDLVFVDLETTGGNAAHHRITEIGIVRVRDDAVVEEWSTLVNPECPIPPYIESFTGITSEMVEGAPRFADICALVLDKLRAPAASSPAGPAESPPVFVAHNARFDYAFLRAEFRRAGVSFCAPVLCTVRLSRRLFPEHVRHNLDAVMERHGLSCGARHRALGDARVVSDFWASLRVSMPPSELARAVSAASRSARLPAHLPAGLAEELPEGWGVYRFYDGDGALLLAGKGACLRSAVLGHFAEEPTGARGRELAAQVRSIEWTEAAGELGAALRELGDVRALEPRHNRRVKSRSAGWTLHICERSGAAAIVAIDELDDPPLESCFGVFHSARDARKALTDIARAKRLCLKTLGLEPGEGSCLAHQLGTCKGACIGKEPPILHALRVRTALVRLKLKAWPFPGRIALVERGPMGCVELHVLDRWTHLGSAQNEEDLSRFLSRPAPGGFDAQIYRLLLRYLAAHPRLEWRDLALVAPPGLADVH